jgi:hypothetical protein
MAFMLTSSRRLLGILLCALVFPLLSACDLLRSAAEAPGNLVGAVLPGGKPDGPPVEQLLPDVLRYSDRIVFKVDEATHEFVERANTPQADIQAASWRLEVLRRTTDMATGPNSIMALLDLVVAVTIASWLQEDYWIPDVWGEKSRPLAIAYERATTDGWSLVSQYLSKEQVEQFRDLLDNWRDENPRINRSMLLDLPSFVKIATSQKGSTAPKDKSGNLLSVVGLDPLTGLAPAARQVELVRQFGERTLFFFQRAPRLISAEVDLKTLRVRDAPETKKLLADEGRITQSIESITQTAANLPAAVKTEREAALNQISDLLTAQRAGLIHDLETAQAPLTTLLTEARGALQAGAQMSSETAVALGALDKFVATVSPPDQPPPPPDEPPSKPFDINDYGTSAEQIGATVRDVSALLAQVNQSLPQIQRVFDTAAERGEQTVDHTLRRVLLIGLVLIGAAALATLLVRWSSTRLSLRRQ